MFYIPMWLCSESWAVSNIRSNITTLEYWLKRRSDYRTRYNTGFLVTGFLIISEDVPTILLNLILFYVKSLIRTWARFRDTYKDFTFTFIRPTILERMTIKA